MLKNAIVDAGVNETFALIAEEQQTVLTVEQVNSAEQAFFQAPNTYTELQVGWWAKLFLSIVTWYEIDYVNSRNFRCLLTYF